MSQSDLVLIGSTLAISIVCTLIFILWGFFSAKSHEAQQEFENTKWEKIFHKFWILYVLVIAVIAVLNMTFDFKYFEILNVILIFLVILFMLIQILVYYKIKKKK